MSGLICPKCGFEPPFDVADCPRCGVVFAKVRAEAIPVNASRPESPTATAPARVPARAIPTHQGLGFHAPVASPAVPAVISAPPSPSWNERTTEPSRIYPVWLAFTLPLFLVAGGVALYRAVTTSELEKNFLRAAKESLAEFVKGQSGPSAIAKAVGRNDNSAVQDLKAGLGREIKSRGALGGVAVEEVEVEVTADGDVSLEIHYRLRVAGVSSQHELSLADSFTPVAPEPPPAAVDYTAGANLPYARPITTVGRPSPPRLSGPPVRFYQPPRITPARIPPSPPPPVSPAPLAR